MAARRARADGFLLFIVTAISQRASTGCSMVIGRMVQARVCCTAWVTWTASLLAYRKKPQVVSLGLSVFARLRLIEYTTGSEGERHLSVVSTAF